MNVSAIELVIEQGSSKGNPLPLFPLNLSPFHLPLAHRLQTLFVYSKHRKGREVKELLQMFDFNSSQEEVITSCPSLGRKEFGDKRILWFYIVRWGKIMLLPLLPLHLFSPMRIWKVESLNWDVPSFRFGGWNHMTLDFPGKESFLWLESESP